MSPQINIPFPIKGISDAVSYHDQTPDTTQLALNMRGRDPVTGRFRGAQRSGMSKFVADQVNASFIQDIAGLVYDINLANYAVASSPSIEWSAINDAANKTPAIAVSLSGDVYIVAGSGVLQKFNTNGDEVLKVQLPLTHDSEEAMAVAVDAQGFVYVSTQATGNGDETTLYDGRIFCYQPSLVVDDQLDLWWTYEADGRVPDIAEHLGTLFAIVNMGDYETELRALESLSSSEPAIRWDRPVANPSNKLVIDSSGDVIVSAPPNADRVDTTVGDACSTKVDPNDMWSPNELGADIRAWFRAEDVPDKTDGELVDFWLDRSNNNRNLTASASSAGLRYIENAVCGMPGLRAWGNLHGSGKPPGLRSLSGQGNPVPVNNDPHFITMVVKLRDPNQIDEFPNGFNGVIFEVGGHPKTKIGVYNGGDVLGFDTSAHFDADGTTAVDATVAQATGSTNIADSDPITNEDKFAIITWAKKPVFGLDLSLGTNGERREASFIRVNGKTHYQYTHNNSANAFRSFFGYGYYEDPPGFQYAFGDMDFCEIISIETDYQWPSDFTGCPDTADAGQLGIDYDTPVVGEESWMGETVALASSDDSEIELVEGYLAHKYGLAGVLDSSHPFAGAGNEPAKVTEDDTDPPVNETDIEVLKSLDGIVAKFGNAGGVLRWAYTGAGVGHGVAVGLDPDDDGVYTTGPVVASPANSTTARRLVDDGFEAFDSGGSANAWELTATNLQSVGVDHRIAVDKQKNVYIPIGDGTNHLVKIDAAAATEFTYTIPTVTLNGICVVPDTIETNYGDDTIEEPEFVYFGGDPGSVGSGDATLYKLRLVNASIDVGAPRGIRHIAVCDGDIRRLEPDAASPNTVVTVTNGSGALNADSRIVRSIEADGKLFFIDGEQYKYYDPVEDEVFVWKAIGSGSLPPRARLIEHWRNRVCLARYEGNASDIFMLEVGNPHGCDLSPPVTTLTQAVSLAAAQAGKVPDIVNAMIPYNDDLMIIGGDHSIWRLTGDPMAAGQLDLVSDMTGMAFGRPWCKDPSGRVYFFGSRGGVFRMSPQEGIVKISSPRLDRRLEQLNLEYFTVRMAYNNQSRGVHIWFVPIDVVPAVYGSGIVSADPSPILDDGNVTISYDANFSVLNAAAAINMNYAFDADWPGSPTAAAMTETVPTTSNIWEATVAVPDGATEIFMTFDDGIVTVTDDNDGDEWSFPIDDSTDPDPDPGNGGPFGGVGIGVDPVDSDPASHAATGQPILHYFYEIDTDAWWADQYADADFDPTAVAVVDGDAVDDRRVLVGGGDGYLRMIDEDTENDDGEAIDAYVRIGPVMPKNAMRQTRFGDFEITLAGDQGGCSASLFAGDTAEPITDSMGDVAMVAGRNSSWLKKVKGQSVFLQLRNSIVDERFAIESMACFAADAGGV